MTDNSPGGRLRFRLTMLFAVLILTPSMLGFAAKFFEFAHTLQASPDGAFAVTPMLNYLLASLGFLCLLLWAVANGMFHDLERPKHRMLEVERQLDAGQKPHQVFKERRHD